MVMVAGVEYPCFDCRLGGRFCRKRGDIMRRVFFSIGNKQTVTCCDYEQARYHGLEGVTA